MTTRFRIPNLPASPPGETRSVQMRARNRDGAVGPATPAVPFRTVQRERARQIRHNNEWLDADDFAQANIIQQLRARTTRDETRIVGQAARIDQLAVDIGTKAAAAALDALRVEVQDNDGEIVALGDRLTALTADVAGRATAMALQALTTRVAANETSTQANASEITALEASIGGRALGPEQNMFAGADRAAAEMARDTYQATNPMVEWDGMTDEWLDHYDADNDLNIELRWGVLYIYQRRLNGAWVDNGEPLARAAAVTQLEARVTQTENVEGGTTLSALARWLVKTQVNDLVGGIGLLNDGSIVSLIVTADTFSILPTSNSDITDRVSPFTVSGGTVYIDNALIRDATIAAAKIETGFIANLVALQGRIQHAQIEQGNIFNLTVGNTIQSNNFVSGMSGFRFTRTGAAQLPAANIIGQLQANQLKVGSGFTVDADGTLNVAAATIDSLDASVIMTGLLDAARIRLNGQLLTRASGGLTVNLMSGGGLTGDENGVSVANEGVTTARLANGATTTGKIGLGALSATRSISGSSSALSTAWTTLGSASIAGATGFHIVVNSRVSVSWPTGSGAGIVLFRIVRAGDNPAGTGIGAEQRNAFSHYFGPHASTATISLQARLQTDMVNASAVSAFAIASVFKR